MEQVWQRDSWLDLLARFIHVEQASAKDKKKPSARRTVFPRFTSGTPSAPLPPTPGRTGPGRTIWCSTPPGPGSRTHIAWLAHRLSSLHSPADAAVLADGVVPNGKVFDKVIVITDRVVLDRQLQDTIFQFDHTVGVVQKIDESSQQLADALSGESAKVIITTLQKFPVVLRNVADLAGRQFAVIVDEAHSSQSGESAKALKAVLGSASREVAAVGTGANGIDAAFDAAERLESKIEAGDDPQDVLAASVAARGRQGNLSFFAFTATPKARRWSCSGRRARSRTPTARSSSVSRAAVPSCARARGWTGPAGSAPSPAPAPGCRTGSSMARSWRSTRTARRISPRVAGGARRRRHRPARVLRL